MVGHVLAAMECSMKQPQAIASVVQSGARLEIEQPSDAMVLTYGIASTPVNQTSGSASSAGDLEPRGPHVPR